MREVFLLFQKGIRHKKGTIFGIFILMFLLTITMVCAISLRIHYNQRAYEAVKQDGYSDVVFWVADQKLEANQVHLNSILTLIEKNPNVKKVESMPYIGSNTLLVNGKEENNSSLIQRINTGFFHYTFFDDKNPKRTIKQKKIQLKKNEVAVPLSYISSYHCKIGDKVQIGTKKNAVILTIKTFFEDPYMGTSLMGIKTLLVNQDTYAQLKDIADHKTDEKIVTGTILNIAKNTDKKPALTDFAFVKSLNKTSQISNYASFSLTKSQSSHYTLLLTNIFSGILIAFLILILAITLIIIRHSIETSLELEYKDIGILKSFGVPQKYIFGYLLMEYLLGIVLGEMIGTLCAVLVVRKIVAMTRTTINLAVSGNLAYLQCFLTEGILLLIMVCFTLLSLRKMNKIHPLKAIRQGKESVYFKSRIQLPITKKGLAFSLAYRQFVFSKKNYIGVSFIVAILCFFLIMVNGMAKWGADGGKNIIKLFSCFDSDLSITYLDSSVQKDIEADITNTTGIKTKFYGNSTYMMVDGLQMHVIAISQAKRYNTVYKGRTCIYNNEVLITQYIANELNKQIGDTLLVSCGKKSYRYMISGIYQCANDTGANIGMSTGGLSHLISTNEVKSDDEIKMHVYQYQLKDVSKKKQLVTYLKKKYDKTKIDVEANDSFDSMNSISYALSAIAVLIYGIAFIFSAVTVALVSGKIVRKEIKDYGIYKAIGYTSQNIRLQLALRMGISAVIGSILGIIAIRVFGKILISKLFEFMGVYHYTIKHSTFTTTGSVVGIVLFFMINSIIFTKKVKKVSTKQLMSES